MKISTRRVLWSDHQLPIATEEALLLISSKYIAESIRRPSQLEKYICIHYVLYHSSRLPSCIKVLGQGKVVLIIG